MVELGEGAREEGEQNAGRNLAGVERGKKSRGQEAEKGGTVKEIKRVKYRQRYLKA